MLCEFAGQNQPHCSLNLARRDSRLLVVRSQLGGLARDAFKDVVDKRIHDAHSLVRDASIGMNLLEDLVDIRRVGLLSRGLLLLDAFARGSLWFLLFLADGSLACGRRFLLCGWRLATS